MAYKGDSVTKKRFAIILIVMVLSAYVIGYNKIKALFKAIAAGDLAYVQKFVKVCANINAKGVLIL
jgi:hypothetical protein